jgi:hypothetical protein
MNNFLVLLIFWTCLTLTRAFLSAARRLNVHRDLHLDLGPIQLNIRNPRALAKYWNTVQRSRLFFQIN